MIPFVAKIEELSLITVKHSENSKHDSKQKATKGGGIVAAIVPATVQAWGFIDYPHFKALDTLTWGFNLKISNPSAHDAIAITGIDCRFIGKKGYGAVSNPYSGVLHALDKSYPKEKVDDTALDSFPLLILPQTTVFYEFTTHLQTYHKKFGLIPIKKTFQRSEVKSQTFNSKLRKKERVTIKTNKGSVVVKL